MPAPRLPHLDGQIASMAALLRQSTARVLDAAASGRATPQGAAVAWTADGLLLTNAHVARAERGARWTVELPDGSRHPARLVARDPAHDLAALRVEATLAPPPLRDARTLRTGELVVALGHPLGVADALSVGVVHATSLTRERQDDDTGAPELVRADVRLAPGNSGGPLADAAGRVVGINAMIAGGLGVAIATERARRFVAALAPRPRLGVTVRTVRIRTRQARPELPAGSATAALLVLAVDPGSAADRAALLPGDLLLAAGSRPLRSADDLLDALRTAPPRTPLALEVGRAGRIHRREVALGDLEHHTRRAA